MQDNNTNGKVDHAVAMFSETLAAYSAGTTPWTLANIPSGGSLASVAVATTNATLTITEGAGAADTAVDAFTVALTTSATGIRDAAGNQASFATTTPTDSAKPVLVAGTLVMKDIDGNGKVDQVSVTFSEPLAASTDTTPWTLTTVPSAGTLPPSRPPARRHPDPQRRRGRREHRRRHLQDRPRRHRHRHPDAAANQSSLASTAPTDGATPVLVSLSMQDTNTNGKVDQVVADLLRDARHLHAPAPPPGPSPTSPAAARLASVAVATTTATLTITEGAGAPDTTVGSFTVALAANATGIRDAAGNQASFAATAPPTAPSPPRRRHW